MTIWIGELLNIKQLNEKTNIEQLMRNAMQSIGKAFIQLKMSFIQT